MPRPIDADLLKNNLMDLPGGYSQSFAGKACLTKIDDAPTLDYVPVRHGEWLVDDNIFTKQRKCSLCGHSDNPKTAIWGHYCWYCGALMDKGEPIE